MGQKNIRTERSWAELCDSLWVSQITHDLITCISTYNGPKQVWIYQRSIKGQSWASQLSIAFMHVWRLTTCCWITNHGTYPVEDWLSFLCGCCFPRALHLEVGSTKLPNPHWQVNLPIVIFQILFKYLYCWDFTGIASLSYLEFKIVMHTSCSSNLCCLPAPSSTIFPEPGWWLCWRSASWEWISHV